MQDEPELATGFSYKMSLKGKSGMLGIDHQHGRFRSGEPGADPGVPGGQRGSAICRATARGGVRGFHSDNGKRRRIYLRWATPFEMFRELPQCAKYLRPPVTLAELDRFAQSQSDTEAALAMQRAKRKLLQSLQQR